MTVDAAKNKVLLLKPEDVVIGWRARKELRQLDELAKSINEIGQLQPIAVVRNDGDFELVAGHRRLEACKKLDRKVKAVIVEKQDDADFIFKQLAENVQRSDFTALELGEGLKHHKKIYEKLHPEARRGQTGGGNNGKGVKTKKPDDAPRFISVAAKELGVSERTAYRALQLANDLTASEKKEIRKIEDPKKRSIAETQALKEISKKNKVKKLEEKARKKQKERGTSGYQTLFKCGDNRKILKEFLRDGLRFDLVCSDPPYQLDWSHIAHTVRADLNEAPTWDQLDMQWVFDVQPLMDKDSTLIAFTPAEAIGLYQEAFHDVGLEYRGFITWHKTNPAPQHRPGYISSVECMVWATQGTPYFKPWENAGSREAHNMIEMPACGGDERLAHPTQKPIELMKKLISRHAMKGDRILDPFAGVASTLVAAKQLELTSYGIELDDEYYRLGKMRLKAL